MSTMFLINFYAPSGQRECKICKQPFKPTTRTQKTCGAKCAAINKTAIRDAWRKKQ